MITLEPYDIIDSHVFGDYLLLIIKELGTKTSSDIPKRYKILHLRNHYYKPVSYFKCYPKYYLEDENPYPFGELYHFVFYIDDTVDRDEEKERVAINALNSMVELGSKWILSVEM